MSESFQDPMYPKGKLYPEQVNVNQHDIDRAVKLQEQNAVQRQQVIDEEKAFTEKQRSFLRIQELKKQLRLAEDAFTKLYDKDKPVKQEPLKKKQKQMILREGEWVELE